LHGLNGKHYHPIKSGLEKSKKKNGVTLGKKEREWKLVMICAQKIQGCMKDIEQSISMEKIPRIHSVSLCTFESEEGDGGVSVLRQSHLANLYNFFPSNSVFFYHLLFPKVNVYHY
jgi:hypothetical protein